MGQTWILGELSLYIKRFDGQTTPTSKLNFLTDSKRCYVKLKVRSGGQQHLRARPLVAHLPTAIVLPAKSNAVMTHFLT